MTKPSTFALPILCVAAFACAEPDAAESPATAMPALLAESQQAVSTGHYGWVLIPNPYDPASTFNSAGGGVRIDGFEPGRYSVRFAGLGAGAGNLQVTAYGEGDARCKLGRAAPTREGDLDVYVLCHAADGTPVRARFAVGYAEGSDFGAYLVADQPRRPIYRPDAHSSYNASGHPNRVLRTGTGRYVTLLGGLGAASGERGHVLVTAYGDGPEHCKVARWDKLGSSVAVEVACFGVGGAPADAGFSLSYADRNVPAPAGVGAYALADQPGVDAYTPSARSEHSAAYDLPDATEADYAPRAGTEQDGSAFLTFPGLSRGEGAAPSAAFVTAYGDDASYCKLLDVRGAEGGVTLRTRCFDGSGAPTEAPFVGRFVSAGAL